MNDNEMNDMKEKVEFFMHSNIKSHVDLKDGTFLNGRFIKEVKKDIYWFEEDKIGEVFIFIKEIIKLEQFRSKHD